MTVSEPPVDVLVVGAGPTGLALAVQARAHGATVRIIDRNADRARESRALAVQARTLEVLTGPGIAARLVERGNPAVRLRLHAGGRQVRLPLFDLGMSDTDYPFLLFLSQAVTEQVLVDHLVRQGVTVEREVTLVDCEQSATEVAATLRHRDGQTRQARARYLVGCDGAKSIVREQAGIRFVGDPYPQRFALADLDVEGLAPDTVHAYVTADGPMLYFPLEHPAAWRLITLRPPGGWPGRDTGSADAPVSLADLQAMADMRTGEQLRLRDPVWLTDFRVHHRRAERYRAGRLFLAGDAAHVHSPAGGQGMNVGIQDAWNLGWKLGLVLRGGADPALLDTYEAERAPVGNRVVRLTDRGFRAVTSDNPLTRFARTVLAPRLLPLVWRVSPLRVTAFRTLAQLTIHYRRSPAVQEGPEVPRGGPRAGDRLPAGAAVVGGRERPVYEVTGAAGLHLLLCGPPGEWPVAELDALQERYGGVLHVHLVAGGEVLRRLGLRSGQLAQYLLRPDAHVSYRATGTDLTGLRNYLERWFPAA